MNNCNYNVPAYDGSEPYIFISYAHADSDTVIPALEAMQQKGCRLWYDRGIDVGTEWSNNIASHLRDCSAFIAFVSRSSVKSENCLDEIAYAKSYKKPSVMIFLEEDVVLPEGTEMQTARFQRLYYSRQASLEMFAENIVSAPILKDCISAPKASVAAVQNSAEVTPPVKAPESKRPMAVESKAKGLKKPAIIGIVAAAVILAIVLCAMLIGGGGSEDLPSGGTGAGSEDQTKAPEAEKRPTYELSDKLEDFTFKLDGVVYKLPFPYTYLAEDGWTTSSNYSPDDYIAGYSDYTIEMVKNGQEIEVTLINESGHARTVKDCIAVEVTAYASGISFEIAKGLTPSTSVEDFVSALGTPKTRNTSGNYEVVKYLTNNDASVEVKFLRYSDEDANMVKYSSITLTYCVITESTVTDTKTEYPEYLKAYVAPDALGDSPLSGNICLDGDLYSFPMPLSALLDNGWSISSGVADIGAYNQDYVNVTRNGVELELRVANYSYFQTIPENCAVNSLSVYNKDGGIIELPGGVDLTITPEDAALLTDSGWDVYEGEYYNSYTMSGDDLDIKLNMDNKKSLAEYIRLSYSGSELSYGD